ncbi:DUF1552 domain-containing protein [Aureliella helgolandensis]|uniref:DUF1552 domain-containing protein n=1 Tax=Aureliella helgolandensis TaxID=2527968 RepID=A0A518G1W3_9BACT|nr:DUF1552 domain-containing protein [Aureliella helgolandensis]QDV22582.1 hypothetical protein Q31a_08680 [Aureliella helgolandensis]
MASKVRMTFLDNQNLRQTALSRRTLLRGTGAALALPWLEAMMPRRALGAGAEDLPQDQSPVRMAALFVPNGVRQDKWTPDAEGRNFQLSPTLEPLEAVKDQLLVLTNLWNQGSNVGDGHYVKTSGFLTCTTINKSLGIDLNCNGRSVDQVAASHSERLTPLPSLELGIDPVTTGVDTNVGYTRVYGSHIAWSGPTSPLARELNPHLVYERLLRSAKPHGKSTKRDALLLDQVIDDAKQLSVRLGVEDRRRMDEYLQSVRSIEKRLERQEQGGLSAWKPRMELDASHAPPEEVPDQFPEHVRLMLDMIALAFQTDTTRVCTFMFGNAVSGRNFSFLDGVSGGHHDTSHHQNSEEKLEQYQKITRWHVEQYAYLLGKLRSMKEGERTVLDNSMILYGSGLRDGNSHSPHNLPILVGGSGGGRIETGQHLSFSPDTPLANLYVAMLNAFGHQTDQFADSTGILPGVLRS